VAPPRLGFGGSPSFATPPPRPQREAPREPKAQASPWTAATSGERMGEPGLENLKVGRVLINHGARCAEVHIRTTHKAHRCKWTSFKSPEKWNCRCVREAIGTDANAPRLAMNCLTTLKHGHEFTDLSLSRLGLFDRADTIQDRVSISAAQPFKEGCGRWILF